MKTKLVNCLDYLINKKRDSLFRKCDLMCEDKVRWDYVERENGYCDGIDEAILLIQTILTDKHGNDYIEEIRE